ncbi:MAG TPA: hypothetical protein VFD63_19885, partial [Pyrinomonadaceae bacterium]|nr:hypothetical protein [Pyrinomonadaceae bacterium]
EEAERALKIPESCKLGRWAERQDPILSRLEPSAAPALNSAYLCGIAVTNNMSKSALTKRSVTKRRAGAAL